MYRVVTFSQSWSDGRVLAKRCQYQEAGEIQHILQVQGQLVPFGEQARYTGPRRVTKFRCPQRSAGKKEQAPSVGIIAGWEEQAG